MNCFNGIRTFLVGAIAAVTISLSAEELHYSVVPGFFEKDPGGIPVGACHGGAAIDEAGNIYISTDTGRGILVFSSAGKFLRAIGPTRIHAMEIRKESGVEYIYAARPSDHEVIKMKLDGSQEWSIPCPVESGLYKDGKGFNPCAVTVGPDGSIFVADGYGSNYVLKFDKDRKFIKSFGGPGTEEGKFQSCHGISLDVRCGTPLLLICNRNGGRVEHWDLEGKFVKVLRKDMTMPSEAYIQGQYAVIPELQGRVTVLDKNGDTAAVVGENPDHKRRPLYSLPPEKWVDGVCNAPHGAAMDKDGNIIVTEWSQFGHLHKFAKGK